MTRSRLAPGTGIVTVPGAGPVLRTSAGEFLRIDMGGVDGGVLVDRLTAGETVPSEGTNSAALDRLVAAFEAEGHTLSTPRSAPLTGRRVHVLGDPVLTRPLARCAAAEGAEVHHSTADRVAELARDPAGHDRLAVVWCLDSPVPEGLWDTADRLPGRRTGWLRCHREGAHSWIEPLAAAPDDVTSRHVRLRRLAATAAHRELAAYWAGHRTPDTGPHPTEASAALIAALLTADLIAWASGETGPHREGGLPARRRMRRIDLRDLSVTEHPVLPVPDVAPLPVPASAETGTAKARP
ncbi:MULTISPECIES: hypothetical protein [unclassified Streptomyces]|uniref:hypothetical protein n=1 Tax=unclassified Streptomyces TaxID=2593676 RepID=UPI00093ECAE6|nr:hypothetical protein [Streptomyces sp. TSRI0281]OKI46858.1 hypothetical protein A6A29_25205 [Streptomyces sp. TSRI0281]